MKRIMRNLPLIGLLSLTVVQVTTGAIVTIKHIYSSATCTGRGSTCKVTINAFLGTPLELDVTKEEIAKTIIDLGKITEDKNYSFGIPSTLGERKIYSFVPSAGELAGNDKLPETTIFLVFENRVGRPRSALAGKKVIKMYRQLQGQKPYEWTDVGSLHTTVPAEELPQADPFQDIPAEVPFIITKTGNLVTVNPSKTLPDGSQESVTYYTGQKNVNA